MRRKRVRILKGSYEDENRWYRCWNCGTRIDSQKVPSGDSTADYVILEDYSETAYFSTGDICQDGRDALTQLACLEGNTALLELGPDGEPKTIRHDFKIVGTLGCPGCGILNWC